MLTLQEKIFCLEEILTYPVENYSESFKIDIMFYFDEFDISNPKFSFLSKIKSKEEIILWVDKLTSRIVLKFDDANEQMNDFIFDYIELG